MAARRATGVWCRGAFSYVLGGGGVSKVNCQNEKTDETSTNPPAAPAVARVGVGAGGSNAAHWRALCAREPGFEPPLMSTEDYYALRWAVYVSYLP